MHIYTSVCIHAQLVHIRGGAALLPQQAGPFALGTARELPLSGVPRSVTKPEAKPGKVSRSPDPLCLPQGCFFIAFFLVASRVCSLEFVYEKKMVIDLWQRQKKVKIDRDLLCLLTR